jgi:hypothetical protein
MDERIKKVAQKLQKSIKNYDDVGSVYQGVRMIAIDQTDYFLHFGPDFLIKLTLYIYSLKKTGDLKLGEKMINNLSFIQLLVTDNEPSIKECKSCDGSGMEICDRCKGIGFIECPKCDGDGEVSCEWCDGDDSEECDECLGEETMNCDKCGGEGDIHCPTCRGESETVCETCGGEGEIVDEYEVVYEIYFIATWNKQIQDLCELRAETLEPVMSLTRFLRSSDQFLELIRWKNSGPLKVDKDQMYCIHYSNEPKMYLQKNMLIRPTNRYIRNLDYLE